MIHPLDVAGAGRIRRAPRLAAALALAVIAASCASGGGPREQHRGPRRGGEEQGMPPGMPVARTLQLIEPLPAFTSEDFAARRDSVMHHMGGGIAVLLGAPAPTSQRRFLQDHDFYYLTGVNAPNAALILNASTGQAELFLEPQSAEDAALHGPRLTPGAAAVQQTGIANIQDRSYLNTTLRQLAQNADTIWLLESPPEPPATSTAAATQAWARISALPWVGIENQNQRLEELVKQRLPGKTIANLSPVLATLRWVKSPQEQAYMRRSGHIAALAVNEAVRSTRPGYFEWEVASSARFIASELGAQAEAFAPVLASGPNVNVTDYTALNRRLSPEDIVLLNYGVDYGYYASDVARTWTAGGQFTAEQMPYYQTAEQVRDSVIGAMKPGVTEKQLLAIAQRVATARGHQSFAWSTARDYIGHFVGMSADDPVPPDVANRPMVPGVVFAVESVVDLPDRHWRFRIDDTVLITATGHDILTSTAPISPAELTALYLETGVVEWWKGQEGVGMSGPH